MLRAVACTSLCESGLSSCALRRSPSALIAAQSCSLWSYAHRLSQLKSVQLRQPIAAAWASAEPCSSPPAQLRAALARPPGQTTCSHHGGITRSDMVRALTRAAGICHSRKVLAGLDPFEPRQIALVRPEDDTDQRVALDAFIAIDRPIREPHPGRALPDAIVPAEIPKAASNDRPGRCSCGSVIQRDQPSVPVRVWMPEGAASQSRTPMAATEPLRALSLGLPQRLSQTYRLACHRPLASPRQVRRGRSACMPSRPPDRLREHAHAGFSACASCQCPVLCQRPVGQADAET